MDGRERFESPHTPSTAIRWKIERDELLETVKALLELDGLSDCDARVVAAQEVVKRIDRADVAKGIR